MKHESGSTRPSDGRSGDLRALPVDQRLIRSAVELWGARGYRGVSVQELVDAAGVTKGAFYHYFDGKEDVLRQIHDQFIDFELEQVAAAIKHGDSNVARLKLITVALAEAAAIYKQESTIFFREMGCLSPETFAAVRGKRDALEALVLGVVEQGMASGELRSGRHPKVITFGILGMCAWVYQWFDPEGPLTGPDIGLLYADVVLSGLLETPPLAEETARPSAARRRKETGK